MAPVYLAATSLHFHPWLGNGGGGVQDEKSCGCKRENGVQRSKNEPPFFFSLPAIQTRRERLDVVVVRRGVGGQNSLPLVTGRGWLQAHASCSSRGLVIYRLYMHLF